MSADGRSNKSARDGEATAEKVRECLGQVGDVELKWPGGKEICQRGERVFFSSFAWRANVLRPGERLRRRGKKESEVMRKQQVGEVGMQNEDQKGEARKVMKRMDFARSRLQMNVVLRGCLEGS